MRAMIRVEFLVGEQVVFRKVFSLPISFNDFKIEDDEK